MKEQAVPEHYSPHITKKIPVDEEGFTQSFNLDDFDPEKVKEFYQQYGLVVFNGVINEKEIENSIDDLWKDMSEWNQGKVKRDDPETWDRTGSLGFVNHKPIVQSQLCKNRSHPNTYKAFKTLYELTSGEQVKQPLLALFDRGSILRPSKMNEKWISPPFYHFDIYPWWWTNTVDYDQNQWRLHNKYNETFQYWLGQGNFVPKVRNFTKIQGVLGFSPTNPLSGGFQCVCGFQNYIKQWCQNHGQTTSIEHCPQLLDNMQRIYQRPGSIILFSRELPHNIFPNLSQNFRYAQYLRMAPESTLMLTPREKQIRQKEVQKFIHKDEDRSNPIVREVYMLSQQSQQSMIQGFKQKIKSFFA